MDGLDPVLLSRIQFAFTISFHIIFPSFTIGLAAWLVVLEILHIRTGKPVYLEIAKFWTRMFAVSFGLGVVSGVVLSYELGTNWSTFTDRTANVLGPLFAYEVMTAFFLEAGFLGIMLFGRDRVPGPVHLFATGMVALGTAISAFWILSANSWMQTPAGFRIDGAGLFHPTDWWAVIFNPSFPYRFAHMLAAAYLTTAFAVGAIGAWYLYERRHEPEGRIMLTMALSIIVWLAPLQAVIGDSHGINTLAHQPAKIAAIEGHWETRAGAPLVLFAIPDAAEEKNHFEIAIPKLGSLILTHSLEGEVRGLKSFAPEDRPNPLIPFFAFRLMVGLGVVMIALGFIGAFLWWRGTLFTTRWYLRAMGFAFPIGWIAVLAGWFTAEVGRQPFVVYGHLRTADAVSPVPGGSVLTSLLLFILIYGVIFGAGVYYMAKQVRAGPTPATEEPPPEADDADLAKRPLAAG